MRAEIVLLLAWICFLPMGLHAQTERTAVLMGEVEPELLGRILGQTSDLDWNIITDSSIMSPNFEQAKDVSKHHNTRIAIWIEVPVDGGWIVHIAEPRSNRLFTKHIKPPADEEKFGSSAAKEAVSLVIRSSLDALSTGDSIGEVVQQTPSTIKPIPKVELDTTPLPVEEPVEVEFRVALGWQAVLDGESSYGQQGPLIRLAVAIDRFEVGLFGSVAVPVELQADELSVRYSRSTAFASTAFAFISHPVIRISTGPAIGMLILWRSPSVYTDELIPEPSAFRSSLLLRWEARLHWVAGWLSRGLGLEITFAVDGIPYPPVFSIEEEDGTEIPQSSFWVVQPVVALSLVANW